MYKLQTQADMSSHNYKELLVWQKSREWVLEAYRATQYFPDEEKYGLKAQLRRAAVSVVSNIAEGAAYGSKRNFIRFLEVAHGSAFEAETQLYLALDLGYISEAQHRDLQGTLTEIQKMLAGLIRRLEA